MVGAGLTTAWPIATMLCWIGAYLLGRRITVADSEGFAGALFLLAVTGAAAAFIA